jgi:hypothetical protein
LTDRNLHAWQGIKTFLDALDRDQREPDPWEAHFMAEAITMLAQGEGEPIFIDAAELSIAWRIHAHDQKVTTDGDAKLTKADLRAAFLSLPVPGGHPS